MHWKVTCLIQLQNFPSSFQSSNSGFCYGAGIDGFGLCLALFYIYTHLGFLSLRLSAKLPVGVILFCFGQNKEVTVQTKSNLTEICKTLESSSMFCTKKERLECKVVVACIYLNPARLGCFMDFSII